jgi:hypothetical protein
MFLKMSVLTRATQRHIPEDGIPHTYVIAEKCVMSELW